MSFAVKLLTLTIAVVPLAAAPAAAQVAPATLRAELDALLAASYPQDGPGATMIVTKGGRTLYAGARGVADMDAGRALTPASVIRIGSITKQFTAAVILQLVGEGKLSLDDRLDKFYPGYPAPGGGATVRQLLNHTSGIQSYTGIPGWMVAANTGRAFTTDQLIAEFRDKPAEFQPGEKWNYNNSGYILLGGIIERVTGKPWYAAIETRIVRPLGLSSIRYGNPPAGPDWARPYTRGAGGVQPAQAIDMSVPQAAGGLVGTVGDVAKWAQALHHGKVVPPALYAQMIAPTKLNDGSTNPYGFGIANGKLRGLAELDHSGGIFGGSTDSLYIPSEDMFVAVFANTDAPQTRPGIVMRRAAAIALGKPFPVLTPQAVDAKSLEPLFGVYAAADGKAPERRLYADGGKLWLRRGDAGAQEVFAAGGGRFGFDNGSLTWFRVLPAAGGYAMELYANGEEPAERATRTGPVPPPAPAITLPAATAQAYVGTYALRIGPAKVALGAGGGLTLEMPGAPPLPMEATSATAFRIPAAALEATLDGKMLTVRSGGREVSGPRTR